MIFLNKNIYIFNFNSNIGRFNDSDFPCESFISLLSRPESICSFRNIRKIMPFSWLHCPSILFSPLKRIPISSVMYGFAWLHKYSAVEANRVEIKKMRSVVFE